jgi:hypothetical protein
MTIRARLLVAAALVAFAANSLGAQASEGLWVNPGQFKPEAPAGEATTEAREPKPIYALASAIGGELSYVIAKEEVGSRMDPYERLTLGIPDHTLDAIVLRGLDRVIARRFPDTDRVFMRLRPAQLKDIAPPDRERVAFERLTAELQKMPDRPRWERIVVVTPLYRAFERSGLGSRLHGVGLYVQDLQSHALYDVIEPDGTPGQQRRGRYLALYYYAKLFVLDAKTLQVIESAPWLIDEKIHDSQSDAVNIVRSLTVEQLSKRLEVFVESASNRALTSTLGGTVEGGEITPVKPQPPAAR